MGGTGRFGMRVVDADGHVVESRAGLARHGWDGRSTPVIDQLLAWGDERHWKGGLTPAATGAWDVEGRLADMDAEGIASAVCYPSPLLGISDFPEAAESVACARAYNDWFAQEWHAPAPERIRGAALVSLLDGEAAADEARRAVVDLGAAAVMVQAYVGEDLHLCDPQFERLWSTLEEVDAPVAVHGSRSTCPPKLRGDMFRDQARFYAMSHPFQQQVAMADLVLGGVLARHPRLRVVFLEAGVGWAPYFVDRLDEAYESVREDWEDGHPELDLRPSEYLLSGNCWFSCEPDERMLPLMVDALGAGQVVYASDYPHFDAKFPDSARVLIEGSGLGAATLAMVAGTNADRLYRA